MLNFSLLGSSRGENSQILPRTQLCRFSSITPLQWGSPHPTEEPVYHGCLSNNTTPSWLTEEVSGSFIESDIVFINTLKIVRPGNCCLILFVCVRGRMCLLSIFLICVHTAVYSVQVCIPGVAVPAAGMTSCRPAVGRRHRLTPCHPPGPTPCPANANHTKPTAGQALPPCTCTWRGSEHSQSDMTFFCIYRV